MVSLKRMLNSGIALMITLSLAMPLAYASSVSDRELREGGRKGSTLAQQQLRKQRQAQRAQRLTPEERRQLRRDIKDAGSEIYPARR